MLPSIDNLNLVCATLYLFVNAAGVGRQSDSITTLVSGIKVSSTVRAVILMLKSYGNLVQAQGSFTLLLSI
ncbi:hypothetical protein J3F83DRAFT_755111 [Trichoderma novae-zelandiae]